MSRTRSAPLTRILAFVAAPLLCLSAHAQPLRAAPAQLSGGAAMSSFDGVVEAVHQTVVAAQVSGAIVQLDVKVGERVKAGQVLLRIDARAADQNAAAGAAQLQAARAALEIASRDFERQKQLHQKNYISQAALDRAESEFKSAQAQANAQLAQAGVARTQSGLYVVRAPFSGVVSDVPVALGDMALPGRPLLTLYDPAALRVTAAVPQSIAMQAAAGTVSGIELPGLAGRITPARTQIMPTVDAATHTVQLRAELPAGQASAAPGMFARLWLAAPNAAAASGGGMPDPAEPVLTVPSQAIVRRAEMTGLYVLAPGGRPVLRQVRLGRVEGARVEVLSGLMPGESVVADPQSAARAR